VKTNRTVKRLALRKALSERLKAGDVMVIDDLKLNSAKTKEFLAVLSVLQVKGSALIVSHSGDENLRRASRNVAQVELTTGQDLNTYQVLRSDKLVFTRSAFDTVAERLTQA
jgi:large subunit ribosomal protein L4